MKTVTKAKTKVSKKQTTQDKNKISKLGRAMRKEYLKDVIVEVGKDIWGLRTA